MAAAGKGRLHEAIVLLANGAEPTLTSRDGSTAQDWAQRFGHQDVADLLAAHTSASAGAGGVADSALALSHYQVCACPEHKRCWGNSWLPIVWLPPCTPPVLQRRR